MDILSEVGSDARQQAVVHTQEAHYWKAQAEAHTNLYHDAIERETQGQKALTSNFANELGHTHDQIHKMHKDFVDGPAKENAYI